MQSGKEILKTGSQEVHPEVPKNFLALTLVTGNVVCCRGRGAEQSTVTHKEHTSWQNNNNNYNNNIIHPGQAQLPQANCKINMYSRVSVGVGRGYPPAHPGFTLIHSLRRGRPLLLPLAETWHRLGRLALPTPPLCAGHSCTRS